MLLQYLYKITFLPSVLTILIKTKEPIYLTQEKLNSLKKDLRKLRSKKQRLNEHWRRAVEEGDDRETDAITVTLKLLEETEHEILKVEHTIFNSKVIVPSAKDTQKHIDIGTQVLIEIDGKQDRFTIVHTIEANPSEGKISNESELGKLLLGKEPGSVIELHSPRKSKKIKIVSILS